MARSRSYFAASNKGKAGEVFLNNMIASGQRKSKQRAKEREAANKRAARDADRAAKARVREREAEAKRAARERDRRWREAEKRQREEEKEQARILKEQAKADKKFDQLVNRAMILCDKHKIAATLAEELARTSLEADLTPAAMEKDLILPHLRRLQVRGVLQPLKESIVPDRFDYLLDELIESEISIEQIGDLPEIKQLINHKILEDYLSDLLSKEEILLDNYEELKEKTWPSVPLDEFEKIHELDEVRAKKKRSTFLLEAVEKNDIAEDALADLLGYINENRIEPDGIVNDAEYLRCVKEKSNFDKTSAALQVIYESKELDFPDYAEFEERAYQALLGFDLEALKQDELYKRLAQEKKDELSDIESIERNWIPDTIKEGEIIPIPDPESVDKKAYADKVEEVEIEELKSFRRSQFTRWIFLGLLGAHRLYAERSVSGLLMFLAFGALIWLGGPNIGETGYFFDSNNANDSVEFDQVVELTRNANLRTEPSTSSKVLATLSLDDETSYQVLRRVEGGDWYQIREIRSVFLATNMEQENQNVFAVGIENVINVLKGEKIELLEGYIYKDLITVDPDNPTSFLNKFSSFEIFLALISVWIFDFFLLVINSRFLRLRQNTSKILL